MSDLAPITSYVRRIPPVLLWLVGGILCFFIADFLIITAITTVSYVYHLSAPPPQDLVTFASWWNTFKSSWWIGLLQGLSLFLLRPRTIFRSLAVGMICSTLVELTLILRYQVPITTMQLFTSSVMISLGVTTNVLLFRRAVKTDWSLLAHAEEKHAVAH